MNNTLRQFVRSVLSEITRYEKETGEKYNVTKEIEQYVESGTGGKPVSYAFTMTSVQKVGINPQTEWETPAGVYAFPLTKDYYKKLLDNSLPFASNAPYCNILKLNLDQKWLIVGKGRGRASNKDVMAVHDKVGPNVVDETFESGQHYDMNNDSKIFDLTFFATKNLNNSASRWTQLLRSLGYVGIYDPGYKVIHSNEPTQLVCLDPSAYEWLETYETREIRKVSMRPVTKSTGPKVNTLQAELEWVKSWDYDDFARMHMAMDYVEKSEHPEVIQALYDKFPEDSKPYKLLVNNKNATQELLSDTLNFMVENYERNPYWIKSSLHKMLLHPNCPPEAWDHVDLLFKPSEDGTSVGEYSALSNPKITEDKLRVMVQTIIGMPFENFFSKSKNFYDLKWEDKQNLRQMLNNPNFPQDILESMLESSPDIRGLALKSPNLPPAQYKKIVNMMLDPDTPTSKKYSLISNVRFKPEDAVKALNMTKSSSDRQDILKNANFSAADLDALASKYTKQSELTGIMQNANVSDKTLRRLSQHPDFDVRDFAIAIIRGKKRGFDV